MKKNKIGVHRDLGKADPRPQETFPLDKKPIEPKTLSDLAAYKKVTINGKVFPGLQYLNINYDIEKTHTMVTMMFIVKRHGITIKDSVVNIETVGKF